MPFINYKKLLIIGAVALLLPSFIHAEYLGPDIPEASKRYSEKTGCVLPKAEMRRNHMNYILDQRTKTMRKGIRDKQFSLKMCIDCHNAPSKVDGKVASYSSKKHFCKSCHSYLAVKIDCFTCHSDKPEGTVYRSEKDAGDHHSSIAPLHGVDLMNIEKQLLASKGEVNE